MTEFLQIMWLPFLACLVLTGIHAYLGLHVIERQVIFVDLALAQIAVLGASCALLLGYHINSPHSYWMSLIFTVVGAAIFSFSRFRKQKVPQEAIIGIIYVVCAALMLIILNFSGEGGEQIRQALIGNILLITPQELLHMFAIYCMVGFVHISCRKKFFLISTNPREAFQSGLNVRGWDFIFYLTFGVVVTSSVKIAGVLLVFSYLVIPAVCAMILCEDLRTRLLVGWGIGVLGSMIGMTVSYFWDLPTGASVVCAFGAIFLLILPKNIIDSRR